MRLTGFTKRSSIYEMPSGIMGSKINLVQWVGCAVEKFYTRIFP